ncbi:MAG: DNA-directed RNA polymerase subunit omega [Clostridiales Family XIII bacterium]|jgi:DNA-directed RNA polymerase subunit omega|nr:DNA-directed RNA polymerase subunit omega [Clostridiales Family XIII bacterium]
MLLYPPINEIRKKADSRYTLVVLAAKRARDLISGKPALTGTDSDVPISIAAEEIMNGDITYSRLTPETETGNEAETGPQGTAASA